MPPPSDHSLSIVIPAFNEASRLPPYLSRIRGYLGGRGLSAEILVVDDGSTDRTGAAVEEIGRTPFTPNVPIRIIRLRKNCGKGAAVRTGMQEATGDLRLLADADGATPIEELPRLEAEVARGADLAIGSRFLASRDRRFSVAARWHRTVLGNMFNHLVQHLGVKGIADTQCGFKLFRAAAAKDLFSVARMDGYGFDLEILYIAQRRGYRIEEVPINWADQPGSKVHVVRDGLAMVGELFKVRRNWASNRYARLPIMGQAPVSAPAGQ